jgi:rhodanese-related sulfurtransferase
MGEIKSISVEGAKALLDQDEAVLIDVREELERKASYIPGSQFVPLSSLTSDKIKEHVRDNKKTLIHCRSGKRSLNACQKVASELEGDFYNVEGGILAWEESGYEVKSKGREVIPLPRQVNIIIALVILLGLMLDYTGASAGLFIALLGAVGLLISNITGFCGLAMLLAKAPWNKL